MAQPGKIAKKRVRFSLKVPDAQRVNLAGDFNGWDPEARSLNRNPKGLWSTSVTLSPGRYQYRFVVDCEWYNDPQCQEVVENEFGGFNNVRVVD